MEFKAITTRREIDARIDELQHLDDNYLTYQETLTATINVIETFQRDARNDVISDVMEHDYIQALERYYGLDNDPVDAIDEDETEELANLENFRAQGQYGWPDIQFYSEEAQRDHIQEEFVVSEDMAKFIDWEVVTKDSLGDWSYIEFQGENFYFLVD